MNKTEIPTAQNPLEEIENLILTIRGKQVMLDRDLARLYGVETKRLNEAVKRNLERFPDDFMFQLTKEEFDNWMSQNATSNSILKGARKCPWQKVVCSFVALLHRCRRNDR